MKKMGLFTKYGFLWVTLGLFIFSLAGHWLFAWFAFVDEQKTQGLPIDTATYVMQTMRDMFENWQSEFLQLLWQVGGLAFLLFVASPQSKEGDERKEEKIDAILRKIDPKGAESIIEQIDARYPKK